MLNSLQGETPTQVSDGMIRLTEVNGAGASGLMNRLEAACTLLNNLKSITLAAFLIASAVMLLHRPFTQAESGDEAIWDYVAQSVLRGQVPYRDVIEIKSPGSAYLSALAIAAGRLLGTRDVIAIRVWEVVLVGLLSALTFLVAEAYLKSRIAALIAFLIPLMSNPFAEWMVAGTQAKLPMIAFGMLSLLLIAKDRPFWAGFCSMISCLCWQPGLLFAGVSFLIFSRYLTRWRDMKALKVAAGTIAPLAVTLLYYYSRGAVGDFWRWTVTFNYSVYGPRNIRGTGDALAHLWRIIVRVFKADVVVVLLSIGGLLGFSAERVRTNITGSVSRESFKDALVIAPVVYLLFCMINFQAGPDLIPLFPFIGVFAGWLLVKLGTWISGSRSASGEGRRVKLGKWLATAALVVIASVVVFRAGTYRYQYGLTLKDQIKNVAAVSALLGPDDRIYVHGAVEVLVLLERPNSNPYIFLDWGKDDYIAAQKEQGFSSVIDELESQTPKLVALSRLQKVTHRAELREWVERHYESLELPGYEGLYLRKQP